MAIKLFDSELKVMDGVKESTGLDLTALLAGVIGGRAAAVQPVTVEVKTEAPAAEAVETDDEPAPAPDEDTALPV